MDRRNFAFSTDERIRSVSTRKILFGSAIVVVGILFGILLFWLINGKTFSKGGGLPLTCSSVPISEKFDCHPDRPVTKKECLRRGCCYKPASDLQVSDDDLIGSSYLGIPSCFFPSDYKGYNFKISRNDTKIEGVLKRKKLPSGFKKDIKSVSLEITFIDDNSLRIQLKDKDDSKRYVPNIPLNVNTLKLQNPLYNVQIDSNGQLAIVRKKSGVTVFKTRLSQLIFSDQFLQLSTYTASTNLYGFGEHKDHQLLKSFNWTRLTLFNQGDLPVPHRNLYGTHPFYLVVEEDGQANGLFLRSTNAMDAVLQPAPAVTLRTIGGIFDLFIMLGPTPADVVKQYTGLVGRPFMIPYWSLGFQLCRYGYFSLNKTDEALKRNLAAGVPIDVQWHDIDYMQRYLDFTYDPVTFEGLDKWVDELHRNGRHYVAMISPGVSNTEPPGTYIAFDEGKKLDLFIKDASGNYIESKVWNTNYSVHLDFSNPRTEKYWADRFNEFHKKLDFDGVWLDMNEPLNFDNGSYKGCPSPSPIEDPQYLPGRPYPLRTLTMCMTARHNFTLHYNEHNLLAFRESIATFKAMKEIRQKRPFIISRATYAGQGVYSGHWSGDITSNWDDLRYTIPFMLVFNLYGMPMVGSDICGFRTNTTMELCARWQALGAFYPFSRNHNDFDTLEQDPAAMGGEVLDATKNALRTRYYLLPYFYYLFYRSHVFGETAVRPLFFEFPTDKIALTIIEQFLWGPSLLISPALYPGVQEVNAYFPKAVWYDFYTGEAINSNGEFRSLPSNITYINLSVRGGYILPLQLPGSTTAESRQNQFDILIALDENGKAAGEFYWDDGDSLDTYKKETYNLIQFSSDKNSFNNTNIKHNYPSKLHLNEIKVYGISQKPSKVTISAQDVTYKFVKNVLSINATGFDLKEDFIAFWI